MEDIKALVPAIAWPLITLIFGIVFLVMFREQIGMLISKIRGVSKDGVTIDSELTPQAEENIIENIFQHLEIEKTAMLEDVENGIVEDLKGRGLDYESDTTKVLVRNLAVTYINLEHEQNYNLIFGSQIHLLKILNEVPGSGKTQSYVAEFYSSIKQGNEEEFSSWELDDYLEFLLNRSLIVIEKDNWHISNKGQDFLIWLARNGKRENKNY